MSAKYGSVSNTILGSNVNSNGTHVNHITHVLLQNQLFSKMLKCALLIKHAHVILHTSSDQNCGLFQQLLVLEITVKAKKKLF